MLVNVLEEFELTEVSLVDRPAQEGATIDIAKNASGAAKPRSTTQEESMDKEEKDKAPEQGLLEKRLADAQAELAVAKALAAMNDGEKQHLATLTGAARDEFVKADAASRQRAVESARAADPVVYTSDSGEQFRKSDDPRLVRLAKAADESLRLAKVEREARENASLAKRAEAELSKLPGTVEVKVALLKSIGMVADTATRQGIEALLAAANTAMGAGFEKRGVSGEQPADGPQARLEKLAKARAEADKVNFYEALDRVLDTEEGQALAMAARTEG